MEDVYYSPLVPKDWLISLPRTLGMQRVAWIRGSLCKPLSLPHDHTFVGPIVQHRRKATRGTGWHTQDESTFLWRYQKSPLQQMLSVGNKICILGAHSHWVRTEQFVTPRGSLLVNRSSCELALHSFYFLLILPSWSLGLYSSPLL